MLLLLGALAAVLLPATEAAAASPTGTLTLLGQTDWVRSTSGMSLDLGVRSSEPPSDLRIQVVLYSPATFRYDFEQSLDGNFGSYTVESASPVKKRLIIPSPGVVSG